ncbi:MAG: ParB/RepB/Spo0J family partition protein [Chloroflexota bacterium]|nr:ParB/RepB/Spo0J family partition protein [Chloroflexota bacterium]
MAGSSDKKRRFSVERRPITTRSAEDFAVVLAGDLAHRRSTPMDIAIEQIDPSPFQIRRTFDNLEELAEAMRVHGFTSRLMVRAHPTVPDRYQLVFGERRLRAARLAGIGIIPCDVTQFDDRELLEIGLTENLQREDLDPLEEAEGLRRFMDEFGYTIREMAERTGKSKGYLDNRLGLLRAPVDLQQMVVARPDTLASVPVIAKLATVEARRPLIEGLTTGKLTATDVRTIVHNTQTDGSLVQLTAGNRQRGQTGAKEPYEGPQGSQDRAGRLSERGLHRARHSLEMMMAQLRETVPTLAPAQQGELLDYIVQTLFPQLEAIMVDLQQKDS